MEINAYGIGGHCIKPVVAERKDEGVCGRRVKRMEQEWGASGSKVARDRGRMGASKHVMQHIGMRS